jgi:hypothetical protein
MFTVKDEDTACKVRPPLFTSKQNYPGESSDWYSGRVCVIGDNTNNYMAV